MALQRIISSPSGSNQAIRDAVVLAEPRRSTLGVTLVDAFREYVDAGIGVVDFFRSRAALFPLASLAAVTAAMNNAQGTLITFTPETPERTSSRYTATGAGIVVPRAALQNVPVLAPSDLWTEDNGSGTPPAFASGDQLTTINILAVPGEDPFGIYEGILSPSTPSYTVSGLLNAIEDALLLQVNSGKSAIAIVNQATRQTLVRIFDATTPGNSDVAAVNGALAVFAGQVTQTSTAVRQYGE